MSRLGPPQGLHRPMTQAWDCSQQHEQSRFWDETNLCGEVADASEREVGASGVLREGETKGRHGVISCKVQGTWKG